MQCRIQRVLKGLRPRMMGCQLLLFEDPIGLLAGAVLFKHGDTFRRPVPRFQCDAREVTCS